MKAAQTLFIAVAVGVLSVSLATAQTYKPTEYLQLVRVHVKPGMTPQFEEYIKKLAEGADEAGAPQQWLGGQVTTGGQGSTYLFALLFDKWAETDSWEAIPNILIKAFGEKDGAQILRSGQTAIAESHVRVYRYLANQSSTITTAPTDAVAFRMSITTVKPSKLGDYNRAMAKVKEASDKNPNAPKAIRRVSVDGPSFTYLSTVPMKSHGERDSWLGPGENIRKAFGEYEGGDIVSTILGSMEDNFSIVLVARPDLSRMPAPSTSN